jgi:serine/threonine protein kinase
MFNDVTFLKLLEQVSLTHGKIVPERLLALSEYIAQLDKKDCFQCMKLLFKPDRKNLDTFILYVIEHHPDNEMGRLFDGAMVDMAIRSKNSGNTSLAHSLLTKLKARRYPNLDVDVCAWLESGSLVARNIATIGNGSYGIVTGYFDSNNNRRAAKTFTYPKSEDKYDLDTFETIFREAIFLRYLTSRNAPNFIEFINAYFSVPQPIITMSYADVGDLQNFIINSNTQAIAQTQHVDFIKQINTGLTFLHQNNIVHRDIKPANILLARNGSGGYTLKICDLGASHFKKFLSLTLGCAATRIYAAPESLSGDEETEKIDVYSLALLWFMIWKTFRNFHPYGDKDYPKDIEKNNKTAFDYLHGAVPLRPSINATLAPQWCRELIKEMWDASPEKRPSTQSISVTLSKYELK